MANFWKRTVNLQTLVMWGSRKIKADVKSGSAGGFRVNLEDGHYLKLGAGKVAVMDRITPGNVAITTGVAAASSTNLRALAALAAAGTATLLDPAGTGAGFQDVPRTVQLAANAGVGNGTLAGASAKGVLVTGLDKDGRVIKETVPLNATTAVQTKKAFSKVTRVDPAINFVGGTDQVSLGYGTGFALTRPVAAAADVIEFAVKASAATGYTVTTLPTVDVGEAVSECAADVTAAATEIVLKASGGAAFVDGAQRTMADIIDKDGTVEEIIITSRTTDTLTVLRGANGTTAVKHQAKAVVAARYGMTATPTVTANDRFAFAYKTPVL